MMALLTDVWAFLVNEMQYVYAVMRYLHARDGLDFVLLLVNGLAALFVTVRLVFASIPPGAVTEPPVRWLRAGVCFTYAWLALRIWSGHYLTPVEPSELIPNLGVAWIVCLYGGDLREFWRTLAAARDNRRKQRRFIAGGQRHGKRA